MVSRISTLDLGYIDGMLSNFSDVLDDKNSLYEAKNNAETTLKHSLTFSSKIILVDDASGFPSNGLLRIGPKSGESGNYELVYYGSRTDTIFKDLIRGFAGSTRTSWPGVTTYAISSVMAEHHNAVRDAIIKIEEKLGTKDFPADGSINKILQDLENKFLAPKPIFRAFPLSGRPELTVNFKPFTDGDIVRYLWDFGDGGTSIEKSPFYTYKSEGLYSVRLNVITSTGAQGISTKSNYIEVSKDDVIPFFYVTLNGSPSAPAKYTFVDQTEGEIIQRYWIFDDGNFKTEFDPDIHTVNHTYTKSGTYSPTLLIIFDNQKLRRAFLQEDIVVL